jgi:hypothetical protein
MLPILLSSLMRLRWHDMRWQPAPVAVFLSMFGVAALCARYLSVVRITRRAAAGLAVSDTVLAAAGTLVIAPGPPTRSPAGWPVKAIVLAANYFIRGPRRAWPRWRLTWPPC